MVKEKPAAVSLSIVSFYTVWTNAGVDDVFIGGKDACSGDSGGPLWKWIKGVPLRIDNEKEKEIGKGAGRD